MSITNFVPDCVLLLRLEASEVGAIMLEYLNRLPPNEQWKFTFGRHFRDDQLKAYPQDQRALAAKVLAEGWAWLLSEGLIAPDPDDNYAVWYFVSRRAADFALSDIGTRRTVSAVEISR